MTRHAASTLILLLGVAVGSLLWPILPRHVDAQEAMLLFGSLSGAPKAVAVDASGNLQVTLVSGSVVTAGFVTSGTAPAVANVGANSCGTTAATVAGNTNTGIITVGATSGTQCRVTFTRAAPTRRQCVANNETTANLARTNPISTTVTDVSGTFVGGDVIAYVCQEY